MDYRFLDAFFSAVIKARDAPTKRMIPPPGHYTRCALKAAHVVCVLIIVFVFAPLTVLMLWGSDICR